MDQTLSFATAIRAYAAKGWKAIPVVCFISFDKEGKTKREKVPLVNWKTFQTRAPTQEELDAWCAMPSAAYAGVELLTGRYSSEVVVCGVDFDQKDGRPDYAPFIDDVSGTMRTKTASGGAHFYYQTSKDLRNATNIFSNNKDSEETIVDFRGEGGVIVVGPTPLWSQDPRQFPLENCELLDRYETQLLQSPTELKPLPNSFTVALSSKTTIGEKKWTQIFSEENRKAPRHEVLISLVGKLLTGISSPEHVEGARHLVHALAKTQFGERFASPEGREEIDKMFQYAIAKQSTNKSAEFQLAKQAINEAKTKPQVEEFEANLKPIRCELREDLVSFYNKDGVKMSMLSKERLVENTFRNLHQLAYGVLLPSIPKKDYERILTTIPIERIKDQSVSLEETLEDVLLEMTAHHTPCLTEKEAKEVVLRKPCGVFRREGGKLTVFFRLRSLFPKLQDEGIRPKRSDLTSALRSIDAQIIRTNAYNCWMYETNIMDENDPE